MFMLQLVIPLPYGLGMLFRIVTSLFVLTSLALGVV